MDCLGKREQGKATICFGFLFCKPIITCRAQWAPCLAHTWKQNSGLGSGHGTIDTSPDTAFPIEMQTSVDMAPVSAPVFRNAFLGSTRSFFFFPFCCQRCFNSELHYLVTSEEAQFRVSAWQELPLMTDLWQAAFFYHFHLEWWRTHTWEDDMALPWWKWCYVSLNCYCFRTEGRGPVIFE